MMKRLLLLCLCMMLVACSQNNDVREMEITKESFCSDKNIVFDSNDEIIFKQYGSKEMIVLSYEEKEELKELSDNLILLNTNSGNVNHDSDSIEVKINGKETYYFRGNTLYYESNENFNGEQVVKVLSSDDLYDFALGMIGANYDKDLKVLEVDEYHNGYLDSENPIKSEMYSKLTSRFIDLEEYLINGYEELINDSKVFTDSIEGYELGEWHEIFEYPFTTLTKYAYSNNDMIRVIVTCEYEDDDTSCEYQALINEDVFKMNSEVVTSNVELTMFYEQTIYDLVNGLINEDVVSLGEEKDGYIKVESLFNEELKTYQDVYDYLHQFFSSEKSKVLCEMLVNSGYIMFDDGVYVRSDAVINDEFVLDIKAYKLSENDNEQSIIVILGCEYGYCIWKEYSYVLENDLWLCD